MTALQYYIELEEVIRTAQAMQKVALAEANTEFLDRYVPGKTLHAFGAALKGISARKVWTYSPACDELADRLRGMRAREQQIRTATSTVKALDPTKDKMFSVSVPTPTPEGEK